MFDVFHRTILNFMIVSKINLHRSFLPALCYPLLITISGGMTLDGKAKIET